MSISCEMGAQLLLVHVGAHIRVSQLSIGIRDQLGNSQQYMKADTAAADETGGGMPPSLSTTIATKTKRRKGRKRRAMIKNETNRLYSF